MEKENDLSIIDQNVENEMTKIINCNEYLERYKLKLTKNDVIEIKERRAEALRQTGRIEFGEWIVEKIIKEFCDSPYISQENFLNTINGLIDIFYYYKNKIKISDDKLIKIMRKYYDDLAQGNLEYLSDIIGERKEDINEF